MSRGPGAASGHHRNGRWLPRLLGLLLTMLLLAGGARAAQVPEPFKKALAALESGKPSAAIDQLELLADQGFVHPDASYNRGLAYARRAAGPRSLPGDLGRAAASFRETTLLRPGDEEARAALERVRREVARQLAQEGHPIQSRPSLTRLVTSLLPEDGWALMGLIGSLVVTGALALRALSSAPSVRLGSAIAAFAGAVALLTGGSLKAVAAHHRQTSQLAVVVSDGTRLRDEQGKPLEPKAGSREVTVPQGADVFVLKRRGRRSRIEWNGRQAWVASRDLRLMPRH